MATSTMAGEEAVAVSGEAEATMAERATKRAVERRMVEGDEEWEEVVMVVKECGRRCEGEIRPAGR